MALLTSWLRVGRRRVLVAKPNFLQYGHLGLEMLMSLEMAKRVGASVFFVRSRRAPGAGLFELDSPEVQVLRPAAPLRAALKIQSGIAAAASAIAFWYDMLREKTYAELDRELSPFLRSQILVPERLRDILRGCRRWVHERAIAIEWKYKNSPSYFQRRMLRAPITVRLRPEAEAEAVRQAAAFGIGPESKLICIHNREPGYKKGQEIHERKPEVGRDDRVRNARIEGYFEACDDLVTRGFTIVRLGDPTMTPVTRPGIVDLATAPTRTNLLEIYCLLRSTLLIAGESGLWGVALLTNTPMLLVNVTEPVAAYPLRAPGLFVPKTIVNRVTGRALTNEEQLGVAYHRRLRDSRHYVYHDTSPRQIAEGVREMLDWIDGRWTESAGQRDYHGKVSAATAQMRNIPYIKKWGGDDGFLGEGRIAKTALHETALHETALNETALNETA